MALSDLAKYSMTQSIARSLSDSWASCNMTSLWAELSKEVQMSCKNLNKHKLEGHSVERMYLRESCVARCINKTLSDERLVSRVGDNTNRVAARSLDAFTR